MAVLVPFTGRIKGFLIPCEVECVDGRIVALYLINETRERSIETDGECHSMKTIPVCEGDN